ncbi:hypothetical protein SCP_0311690 [Sparassis crispa]|uniref:Uncharacterized protein n=1 Tax=Sparassis crispa TaxID=139825 RepID=A0A401GGY7_9APHY|nr:hypothetical protein SCP_0311690 [Sparassis crispa]GBE81440.1 hypothetical protein SCP_0311690 [Sparassis crispa]
MKVPILHPGNISPTVMCEYEHACRNYFEHKEISDDKHVRKILAGIKDSRICDWIASNRA